MKDHYVVLRGRTFVTCVQCSNVGCCIKDTLPVAVSITLRAGKWCPHLTIPNGWICPVCNGLEFPTRPRLKARLPMPLNTIIPRFVKRKPRKNR